MEATDGRVARQGFSLPPDLEERTRAYRHARAAWHTTQARLRRERAAQIRGAVGPAVHDPSAPPTVRALADELRALKGSRVWHLARAKGYRQRFQKLRACGTQGIVASCKSCGESGGVMPLGCSVNRWCESCGMRAAVERRARFGRARARATEEIRRRGLFFRFIKGGAWSDKMLTLTLPHVDAITPRVVERRLRNPGPADDSPIRYDESALPLVGHTHPTAQRVALAFRAWALFAGPFRKYLRGLEARGARIVYHRAFELTPGDDALGHPHFHLWLLSPLIDVARVSRLWTEAVARAGAPLPDGKLCRVKIQRFHVVDVRAKRELLKGGRRKLGLTYSKLTPLEDNPERTGKGGVPSSPVAYAEGWTIGDVAGDMAPEAVASLEVALDGKRLVQASSGFFKDDEPAACPCCNYQGRDDVVDGKHVHRSAFIIGIIPSVELARHGPTLTKARPREGPERERVACNSG